LPQSVQVPGAFTCTNCQHEHSHRTVFFVTFSDLDTPLPTLLMFERLF